MAGQKFQYDESGGTFFYFLLSFLALILIPATLYYWPRKKKEGTCYQLIISGKTCTPHKNNSSSSSSFLQCALCGFFYCWLWHLRMFRVMYGYCLFNYSNVLDVCMWSMLITWTRLLDEYWYGGKFEENQHVVFVDTIWMRSSVNENYSRRIQLALFDHRLRTMNIFCVSISVLPSLSVSAVIWEKTKLYFMFSSSLFLWHRSK